MCHTLAGPLSTILRVDVPKAYGAHSVCISLTGLLSVCSKRGVLHELCVCLHSALLDMTGRHPDPKRCSTTISNAQRFATVSLLPTLPLDCPPNAVLALYQVIYHRLIPEEAYAPYDPTRSGSVTESVFRRGLSDAFRLPFSDDQLDTLTRRYRHGGNKV